MKKAFDCVEMKRRIQEEIYRETHRLSRAEEIAYFRSAGDRFWQEIESLRSKRFARSRRPRRVG